ncbi:MAG: hypothetical protein IJM81_10770 [Prevotella sp.]|nr:hypothetical protein [Prevotella sp.]MBQ6955326.1 hypothetical protein [Bacteroidales bacterium]
MEHVINLKKGFGSIQFGTPVEDIVALLGEADEVESMENAFDEPTTVLHYFDGELTLFFEGDSPTLQCIDSSMDDCLLFGKRIFDSNETEIVRLMVENHYCQEDVDDEAWGERRVSFGEANVDFFFDNGVLSSVVWGV